jgi:hypothetical protein
MSEIGSAQQAIELLKRLSVPGLEAGSGIDRLRGAHTVPVPAAKESALRAIEDRLHDKWPFVGRLFALSAERKWLMKPVECIWVFVREGTVCRVRARDNRHAARGGAIEAAECHKVG